MEIRRKITIKLRWGMGKRRYKNWLQTFSWIIKFSSNSTMMGCRYLHTWVGPPEMREKKSKLRCLWIVPQAVEVKGRIKNRKRWRYLTEQAHTPVLVKLMSTAWKPSILLRDLSVKRFLLTFCAIIINVKRHFLSHVRTRSFLLSPPFFFPSRVDDYREEEVPQSEPESLFYLLKPTFQYMYRIMYCTHYSKSAVVFWYVDM